MRAARYLLDVRNGPESKSFQLRVYAKDATEQEQEYRLFAFASDADKASLVKTALARIAAAWPALAFEFRSDDQHNIVEVL